MKGWQIFRHSIRQVTGNFEAALRVSGVLYLAQYVVGFVLLGGMAISKSGPAGMLENGLGAGFALGVIVAMVAAIVTGLWIAVGWHRFVLLGERASLVPVFRGDRMWAYFLYSLGYGLILILIGAIWGGIVGFVIVGLLGNSVGLAVLLMGVLIYVPLLIIAFRLTAALPGVALGADISFLSGWNATRGRDVEIAGLGLIVVLIVVVLELVATLIFGNVMALMFLWTFVMGWLQMIVGVSILTTLYGHYIEKRDLV